MAKRICFIQTFSIYWYDHVFDECHDDCPVMRTGI